MAHGPFGGMSERIEKNRRRLGIMLSKMSSLNSTTFSRIVEAVFDTSVRKVMNDLIVGSEPSTEEDPMDIPIRK